MHKFLMAGIATLLICAAASAFLWNNRQASLSPQTSQARLDAPTFIWSYQTEEREGIPYTQISLTATYENGQTERGAIDQVEGHCNDYEPEANDTYERSTMIICYYAGLGRYFKVVESGGEYLVQRRVFEEASPEYDPPVEAFETVARF